MGGLTAWLNKKIAKILGDLEEREPLKDPSPARACCRIFFLVSLLLGFLLMLGYNFMDAPDARVVQIHRLTPGAKNHAFPSCFLYEWNSTDCKKWPTAKFPLRTSISCPCTNSTAPWKNFVKFYVLHENSTVWNMGFTAPTSVSTVNPAITVPDDTIPLGNESIVKDTQSLTAERFCDLSALWPIADYTTSPGMVYYRTWNVVDYPVLLEDCVWMATLLFNSSHPEYEDRARSTEFLNTPTLLSREELNTLLAQLARDSVLARRLALDMALSLDPSNGNFRRFYNALAHMLTELLDRDEMDPAQSYVYGARELSGTLSSNQFYDSNAKIWYLGDPDPIFLQPQIDWEAYRQTCSPEYCEVIKPLRGARRLYWAFGILGGVATIILAAVTTLLWPCTAMLLLWVSKCFAAAPVPLDPERPKGTLMQDPGLLLQPYNPRL